jgi:hypothetical protein
VVVVVWMLRKMFAKSLQRVYVSLIRPKCNFRVELLALLAIGVVRQHRK